MILEILGLFVVAGATLAPFLIPYGMEVLKLWLQS